MDDMIYLHMPNWLCVSSEISFSAKFIMMRIFTLSKDGLQHVFVKRADFASFFGASVKTISRGLKELLDFGLIKEEHNPNKWDRVRYFSVTQKALKKAGQNVSDGSEENTENGQNVPLKMDKMSPISETKCPDLLLDRSIDRYECDLYNKETTKVTEEETKEWLSIPPVSEDEFESEVVSNKETTYPLTMTSTPTACVKEKSSAKREKNKKFIVPSYAEVVALITNWARLHMSRYPQLGRLDCALEAENFISYWESCGWKRKGQPIKSLNGTIATWLINALKYGNIAVKSYNPAQDYRKTGLTREMNQEIANNIVPKAVEFSKRLKEAEQQEEQRRRHVDEIEELENNQYQKLGVF